MDPWCPRVPRGHRRTNGDTDPSRCPRVTLCPRIPRGRWLWGVPGGCWEPSWPWIQGSPRHSVSPHPPGTTEDPWGRRSGMAPCPPGTAEDLWGHGSKTAPRHSVSPYPVGTLEDPWGHRCTTPPCPPRTWGAPGDMDPGCPHGTVSPHPSGTRIPDVPMSPFVPMAAPTDVRNPRGRGRRCPHVPLCPHGGPRGHEVGVSSRPSHVPMSPRDTGGPW